MNAGDKIVVRLIDGESTQNGTVEFKAKHDGRTCVFYRTEEGQATWCHLCDIVTVNGQQAPVMWMAE